MNQFLDRLSNEAAKHEFVLRVCSRTHWQLIKDNKPVANCWPTTFKTQLLSDRHSTSHQDEENVFKTLCSFMSEHSSKNPTFQLRQYQSDAVQAVYDHLQNKSNNPCVCLPTGAGKTPVIAELCRETVGRWNRRVLVLAHVKELLEQAVDKLAKMCPGIDVGVYSAGLKRRDEDSQVLVAGIQSVYKRVGDIGSFDLVLVDECHLIPPSGDGMYRKLLDDLHVVNPHVRVVGLTATPYRLGHGLICSPDHFVNEICYEAEVPDLICDGYLSPLTSQPSRLSVDTSGVARRGGEFVDKDLAAVMDADVVVATACDEILEATQDRESVLIFACSVAHAIHVAETIYATNQSVDMVCGDTPDDERAKLLNDFRAGRLKYLVNVNVLTTGFDAPNVDCVVLLRPTLSAGLYYQMCGRGFRLHDGKADCLVLDFGGNIERHGPVDQIKSRQREARSESSDGERPFKTCEKCGAKNAVRSTHCVDCGHEFPPLEDVAPHDAQASNAAILASQVEPVTETYDVLDVAYTVHHKRDAPEDAPKSMRVEYQLGLNHYQSEWICVEHEGFARQKAVAWWRRRSYDPVPTSAEDAVMLAEAGALAQTFKVTVKETPGERFKSITGYEIGPLPPDPVDRREVFADEEIPF